MSKAKLARTNRFLREGKDDIWYMQNKDALGKHDPVQGLFDRSVDFAPKSVLEIGCSTGWRLAKMRSKYRCKIAGVEPSIKAIRAGNKQFRFASGTLKQGSAVALPFPDNSFDTVIFGFCVCLCDPAEWPRVVAESDRVLRTGGLIVVHDYFYEGEGVLLARVRSYDPPLHLYCYDFEKMWRWHPLYQTIIVSRDKNRSLGPPDNINEAVMVLRKVSEHEAQRATVK